ncbi:L-2-hydroxyglutarate oxidase [Tsukamurella sp. 8F]|uniref:L-2-hydroxyglutarate oxidase n=1 Tax=unclassified Tsukamurella TaxID=2633480 RepID=UPI0023BA0C41|nr:MULTISPECIES: L-2-hydroxyglutarate oxidase [unclassified Tsukamurella]MDF0529109.1 L-2-hydroxyglutarate oxidase [Tsukamurella sp. 8J]MDF0588141.1 L-2-hydroxyglutarate oxidase [Tsukamurella sp. 8F]
METVGIVGGGIVGLAVAREVIRRRPGTRVVVFEREDDVGRHQTGHNSGVVHAGIYYAPGSLKAQLCTRGRDLLRDYCAEHRIAYERCGKLVVAVDSAELPRLDELERKATANGVPGLRRVDVSAITEIEPHATGLAALHSPHTAITDYPAVCRALADGVRAQGGDVLLQTEVTGLRRAHGGVELQTAGGEPRAVGRVVLCGGLESDRLGRLAGGPADPRIVPFRGEYMRVDPAKQELVRGMVYPVPDPRYPFLGVHFTRRVDGTLEVGPNAFLALSRRRYGRASVGAADVLDTLRWPGFWRFVGTHWRTGFAEAAGVLSVRAYMRAAQVYVPEIGAADVARAGLGLRAQALGADGSLVDDFVIHSASRVTSVRNAPSPAATSSLAIAEYIVDRIDFAA